MSLAGSHGPCSREHGRLNFAPVFTARVDESHISLQHCFSRHFASKVDEFNKKKKLLLSVTSLLITACIRRKKKCNCWTRSWLLRRVEHSTASAYAGTRVVH